MTDPSWAPPRAQPTWNALAIIGFVLAFVVPPGAIVCGHIARRQIRTSHEQGDGLALAGLVLGYVFTGFIVLLVLVWLGVLITTLVGFLAVMTQLPTVRS